MSDVSDEVGVGKREPTGASSSEGTNEVGALDT